MSTNGAGRSVRAASQERRKGTITTLCSNSSLDISSNLCCSCSAVSAVVFILVSLSPIDPVQANVGQAAYVSMSEAKRAQLASYWGVDTPLWERYANWLAAFVQGDMGTSLRFNAPVSEVVAVRFLNSFVLMAVAWVVSGVLGFALGVVAGVFKGRWPDRVVKGYCFVLASTPTFWLGLVALMVFSVWLGWFPLGSLHSHWHVCRGRDAC